MLSRLRKYWMHLPCKKYHKGFGPFALFVQKLTVGTATLSKAVTILFMAELNKCLPQLI